MQHLGLLNHPITLETILSLLPTDVRAFIEKLLVESVQTMSQSEPANRPQSSAKGH